MNTRSTEVREPRDGLGNSREPRHVFDVLDGGPETRADARAPADTAPLHDAHELSAAPTGKGRRTAVMSIIALLVLAGAGAWFMQTRQAETPAIAGEAPPVSPVVDPGTASNRPVALTVALVTPEPVKWADEISASGAISAWQEAVVSAEVSGLRLREINVDVGDQVTRGQVLARFDDAVMLAQVAQQKALVEQAVARLAEADANAVRAESLRKRAAISEQERIQFVTRADAARAELDSAKARLVSAELNLRFTTVHAPDDGVVSARTAMLGAVTGPGAELFRLVRQNRLEWRAELTGAQLLAVSAGQQATLTLPDGSTAIGSVRQVAPVLDAKSRTGVAYVELDRTQSPSARAGMFASGAIVTGERTGIAVPASAVVLRDGYQYVFVVGEDERVQAVKVETGRREGELVEITDGIVATQAIVGAGAAFLNSGDPVRVVENAVAGA